LPNELNALQRLKRFPAAREGAFALWLAAAILPIAVLVGAATDVRRIEVMRSALQDASDAAILAAAKSYLATDATDAERLAAARKSAGEAFRANDSKLGSLRDLGWSVDYAPNGSGELLLTTRGAVPLAFGGLLGMDAAPVEVTAASVVELRLEVALVLDTTGSMATNNRIGRLKRATDGLITQLALAAKQSSRTDPLKIALVPYSNTVRVPKAFTTNPQTVAWLDGSSRGPSYNETDPPPPTLRDRFTRYPSGWRGCVETRPGRHDVENTPPSRSDPDTLYVPYFNPGPNPNAGCEVSPVIPLTDKVQPLKTAVRGLEIGGLTNIPMGLAWGWKVLTPTGGPLGPGAAEPYGNADLVKAVVLMTDGENNLGDPSNNIYTGVGRMEQARVGVDEKSSFRERQRALDERLTRLCTLMKAKGIVIYAVRVEEGDQELLRDCASERRDGSRRFWNVTNAADLPAVFSSIGEELIEVRLSR